MAQRSKKAEHADMNAVRYDAKGNKDGVADLDRKVFDGIYNRDVIYQAVRMYEANKRAGLANTKQRNEVHGGNKKPWRQKGTGRARVGSTRNPLWRHGGIVFGPHPREFRYDMPKKVKALALVHSLNSKLADGKFSVIKDLSVDEPKTKKVKVVIDKLSLKGTTLVAVDKAERNLVLAARNLSELTLVEYPNLNALDILKHSNFVITEKGLAGLTERLKG